MKIINTKIENNILTITLDSASSVTKVYLDNVLNKKNMYSENDEDHNHVVNSPNISDNTITIDITEYDSTSFIVNVVGKNLYYRKVNMLVTFCNTCLDKHQKEKILMCDFKSQLLEYALANQLTEDAIDYYVDLCRLLEIPLEHTCCTYNRITNCRVCRGCTNGCCVL